MSNIQTPKRRNGPDFWIRLVQWVGGLSWLILLIALSILEKAQPKEESLFSRLKHHELRTWWDLELASYFFYIMILLFSLSLFTLLINSKRLKRKGDRLNLSVIIIGFISFIGSVLYLIYF